MIRICPHCGNHALQQLAWNVQYDTLSFPPDGTQSTSIQQFLAFLCTSCRTPSLHRVKTPAQNVEAAETILLWPHPPTLHHSIPDRVRSCYDEVTRIKNLSPKGIAVAKLKENAEKAISEIDEAAELFS